MQSLRDSRKCDKPKGWLQTRAGCGSVRPALPGHVSGTDILRQIRADKRLIETRVIVITGHPELAEAIRDEADRGAQQTC